MLESLTFTQVVSGTIHSIIHSLHYDRRPSFKKIIIFREYFFNKNVCKVHNLCKPKATLLCSFINKSEEEQIAISAQFEKTMLRFDPMMNEG